MGTSASYGGPKGSNPLVPSWVDTPLPGEAAPPAEGDGQQAAGGNDGTHDGEPDRTPTPSLGPSRLTPLRSAIRTSARSGGSDGPALRAAARHFVSKSMGGARRGAQRMGVARRAGGRLVQAFSALTAGGASQLARMLQLRSLAGLSATQVWDRLAEFVCSDGGSIDEAIVKAAFCQTLKQEMDDGLTDLLDANPEQLASFFEHFIGECVIERLSQDGGSLLEQNGVSAATAFAHMQTLRSLVSVFVSQRLAARAGRRLPANYDSRQIDSIVVGTLRDAIAAVGEWGESE